MTKYFLVFICCIFSMLIYAQDSTTVTEAATGLRAGGKIYVVVAVVITILLGLIIYLVTLDRKISRMEKHQS